MDEAERFNSEHSSRGAGHVQKDGNLLPHGTQTNTQTRMACLPGLGIDEARRLSFQISAKAVWEGQSRAGAGSHGCQMSAIRSQKEEAVQYPTRLTDVGCQMSESRKEESIRNPIPATRHPSNAFPGT